MPLSPGPSTAEAIWQAGRAIFGEGFWILPAIDRRLVRTRGAPRSSRRRPARP